MSGKTNRSHGFQSPQSISKGGNQHPDPEQSDHAGSTDSGLYDLSLEIPGISHRQRLALTSVATAPTTVEGARRSGVAVSTLRRWLEEPAFRQELERQREEAYNLAIKQVQALVPECLAVLAKIAVDCEDPILRMRAARYLLSYGVKYREISELYNRISYLQQAYEVDKSTKRQD